MNIGLIGFGVVGKAAENTLRKKHKIIKYDKYQDLDPFDDLKTCDFVFIMIPTPFDSKKNKVDESAIIENLEILDREKYSGIVIIKSTVFPGATDNYSKKYKLNIVYNPEFLRESTSPNEDFKNQQTVVIGTNNKDFFIDLKEMYQKVLSPTTRYFCVSPVEAEMIKYSQNTMLASRVAIANMIYDACLEVGVEYALIKEIAFDRFEIIGRHMSQVPGPDGKRGFGGKCLPKDILGFNQIFKSKLLNEINDYNKSLRDDLSKSLKNYNED